MQILKKEIGPSRFKVQLGALLNSEEVSGAVELDIENQAVFVDFMNNIFDESNIDVVLDMQNVGYMDSSGLWALFEGHKKASRNNGNLVLINATKDVKRVLDITKMSSKIRLYATIEEALKALDTKSNA